MTRVWMSRRRWRDGGRGAGWSRLSLWLIPLVALAVLLLAEEQNDSRAIGLAGTVLDETGAPIEGAEVALHPVPSEGERMAILLGGKERPEAVVQRHTDRQGRFTIDAPGPGFWTLVVRSEGCVPMAFSLPRGRPLHGPPPGAPRGPFEVAPVMLPRDVGLEVEVVNEEGEPVSGAIVRLTGRDLREGEDPNIWRPWLGTDRVAASSSDGRAHLPASALGPGSLRATKGARIGWLRFEAIPAEAPDAGLQRLVLERRPSRRLRVVRPDGQPAEGALVWALNSPVGRTGADGWVAVPLFERSGRAFALDEGPDGPLAGSILLPPADEAPTEPGRLTLQPFSEVAGRVIAGEGLRSVEGALVWASGDPGGVVPIDRDGEFRLRGGWVPHQLELKAAASGSGLGGRTAERGAEGFPRDVVVELDAAAWVSGSVVDEEDRPVPGVRLGVYRRNQLGHLAESSLRYAWTGPEGRFLIQGLDPRQSYDLRAYKEGHAPASTKLLPRPVGEAGAATAVADLRLVLREPRTVIGRVVDRMGRSVVGAGVSLFGLEELRDDNVWVQVPDRTQETGSDGRFELENPVPRESLLVVIATGHGPLFQPVAVPDQGGVIDLGEVEVDLEGVVRGRVLDRQGDPVTGAEVRESIVSTPAHFRDLLFRPLERQGRRRPLLTGADGAFVLGGFLPGEQVQLKVTKAGFGREEIWARANPTDAGIEPVEVVLRPAGRIRGVVLDEYGRPAPRATVAPDTSRADGGWFQWAQTDERGRFEVPAVDPGRFYLVAKASGHARSEPVLQDVSPGDQIDGVEIMLRPGFDFAGRVVDSKGRPVEGARVWAHPGSIVQTTDADGRFSIEDRSLGLVKLSVEREGYLKLERLVDFPEGADPVEVRLPGAEVSGMLVDSRGEPLPGREIQLLDLGSRVISSEARKTLTATDGSFRYRGVPDGAYRVAVFDAHLPEAGWTDAEPVEVRDGRSVEGADVRFPALVTVSGKLLGPDGVDWRQAQILATTEGAGFLASWRGEVLEDGGYRVDIPAGQWVLVAYVPIPRSCAAEEITAGAEDLTVDLQLEQCPEGAEESPEER